MSAIKETLIFCDGNGGGILANDFSCPNTDAYGGGDARQQSARQQRMGYGADGWVFRAGKDYCPECKKRKPWLTSNAQANSAPGGLIARSPGSEATES